MKRRSVLHAVGLTGVGGVAGCLRQSAGEDGGCPAPSGNLVAVFPSGGEYEQQGATTNDGDDDDNIEQTAFATYKRRDGQPLSFSIAKYSSGTAASEAWTNATSQESQNGAPGLLSLQVNRSKEESQGSQNGAIGYIIADNYVYYAVGPDKESVKTLMTNAKSLDSDCVDNNIEFEFAEPQ